MEFEHFALNVSDPATMASWYVEHCGMRVVHSVEQAPYAHFLSDEGGRMVMEIYSNPTAPIPDYRTQHPLSFHIAFDEPDIETVKDRLIAAGASFVGENRLDDGSLLIMLRDPWGVPLQLCKRGTPLLRADTR